MKIIVVGWTKFLDEKLNDNFSKLEADVKIAKKYK